MDVSLSLSKAGFDNLIVFDKLRLTAQLNSTLFTLHGPLS